MESLPLNDRCDDPQSFGFRVLILLGACFQPSNSRRINDFGLWRGFSWGRIGQNVRIVRFPVLFEFGHRVNVAVMRQFAICWYFLLRILFNSGRH